LRILLDENFPLQLYRRLLDAGHDAEHIIALSQRGYLTKRSACGWWRRSISSFSPLDAFEIGRLQGRLFEVLEPEKSLPCEADCDRLPRPFEGASGVS
jgi:hypothetical protein